MSSSSKIWIAIGVIVVIIIIILAVVGWSSNQVPTTNSTTASATNGGANPSNTQGVDQNAPLMSKTSAASSVGVSSNSSLNQDLTNIDTQLNGLNTDSASADQGLNDQPVPQN